MTHQTPTDARPKIRSGDLPPIPSDPLQLQLRALVRNRTQSLAVLVIFLFYIAQNLVTVLYQARNGSTGRPLGVSAIAAYCGGALMWSFFLHFLQTRKHWLSEDRGKKLRRALLFMLLLPATASFVSLRITGWQGNAFLNVFLPFLWSLHLLVAPVMFMRHARAPLQALFLGLAMGAGHICWALVMPLAGAPGPDGIVTFMGIEGRHLQFISLATFLAAAGFAVAVYKLVSVEADVVSGGTEGDRSNPFPLYGVGTGFPRVRFLCILAPFLACFMLNGMTGYLFLPRFAARGLYPEFMHLVLALVFPLIGLLLARKGERLLLRLLAAAVVYAALLPILYVLHDSAVLRHVVYLTGAALQQILLFCGVLIFARFAYWSRFPVLVASTIWISVNMAFLGNILASRVFPWLGLAPSEGVILGAGLCLVSLLPLRKSFPLPEYPAALIPSQPTNACHPTVAEHRLFPDRPASDPKGIAFSLAFGLSARESEVLRGIANSLKPEAIAAEMGITARTVRFHQTSLFKKTGQPSAHKLALYYASWVQRQEK